MLEANHVTICAPDARKASEIGFRCTVLMKQIEGARTFPEFLDIDRKITLLGRHQPEVVSATAKFLETVIGNKVKLKNEVLYSQARTGEALQMV